MWPCDAILVHKILINTGSGNGLLPAGTTLLPEPIWLAVSKVVWHSFQGNVCLNAQDINPRVLFEIYTFKINATFPWGWWVNKHFWNSPHVRSLSINIVHALSCFALWWETILPITFSITSLVLRQLNWMINPVFVDSIRVDWRYT